MMRAGGFLDLKNRPGKAGGGFCTSFPTVGAPYIFANFNGTHHDIGVFTHEMGHAFQNWQSRDQPGVDYLWPTMEAAEIHSMGLEFLTYPVIDRLVGQGEADRFRRMHLIGALAFLPYGVCVDHFQHEVYANPDATPAERHAMWQRLERIYMPWSTMAIWPIPRRAAAGRRSSTSTIRHSTTSTTLWRNAARCSSGYVPGATARRRWRPMSRCADAAARRHSRTWSGRRGWCRRSPPAHWPMSCARRRRCSEREVTADATAIFEVASDETAATDRVIKFSEYAAVPSLRCYVLLEQTAMAAALYQREPTGPQSGQWIATAHTEGALRLPGLDITLPLENRYQGLTFGAQA